MENKSLTITLYATAFVLILLLNLYYAPLGFLILCILIFKRLRSTKPWIYYILFSIVAFTISELVARVHPNHDVYHIHEWFYKLQIGEEPAYVTREIVYYWLLNIFAKYTNADRFLASTIFISYLLLFISVEKLERARESPNQIIIGILLIASLPILLNNAIQLNKQFLATSLFVSYIALDITQKSLYKLIPLFISIFTHVVILPLFALYLLLKIYNYDGRLVKKIVILISICICFLLSYIFDLFQVNYAVQRILMHENLTHGNPSSMMNIVLFIILGLVCWDSRTTEAVVKGDIIIMQFIVLLVLSLSALTFVGLYMVPMRLFYLVVLMLIVSGSIQRQLYRLNFNLYFSALIIYSAYFMANIHDGPFYFDGGLLNIKN